MMRKEKRSARRFELALPVILLATDREKSTRTIHTRDISSAGVLLQYNEEVHAGMAMELVVTLPGFMTQATPVRLRCIGRVVRVDRDHRNRMGVVAVKIERHEFMRFRDKSDREALLHSNIRTTHAASSS